jgi:hypothetical protein
MVLHGGIRSLLAEEQHRRGSSRDHNAGNHSNQNKLFVSRNHCLTSETEVVAEELGKGAPIARSSSAMRASKLAAALK